MANIYATHKPEGSGDSQFLKIKDGETVKIRLASEPAIFESESQPDENGQTRISTRYAWVVWNQDKQVAQILQQSPTFFKQIASYAQDDDYGDPTKYDIKVRREGEALNTTYHVTPSPKKEPLSVAAQQAVQAVDLLAKLESSPFSQRVTWLADFESAAAAAPPTSPGPTQQQQAAIKAVGGEPINLDDIPF